LASCNISLSVGADRLVALNSPHSLYNSFGDYSINSVDVCVRVTAGIVSETAIASRPGVSPHAATAAAAAGAAPKELTKDAVIAMHSISATVYVKGLTYQHILSVDMFTKEQVCQLCHACKTQFTYYYCFFA